LHLEERRKSEPSPSPSSPGEREKESSSGLTGGDDPLCHEVRHLGVGLVVLGEELDDLLRSPARLEVPLELVEDPRLHDVVRTRELVEALGENELGALPLIPLPALRLESQQRLRLSQLLQIFLGLIK
jgi:hypothetical protein